MKTITILLIFVLFNSIHLVAGTPTLDKNSNKHQKKEINKKKKKEKEVDKDRLYSRKLINQQFTNIVTGSTKSSIGNSASLDLTKSPQVSFAASSVFKNGSVLGFKIEGGTSDGILAIFTNSKLNTNISFDIQYNLLSPGIKNLINTYTDDDIEYSWKRDSIILKYTIDSLFVSRNQNLYPLELQITNQKKHKDKIETLLKAKNIPQKTFDSLSFLREQDSLLINQMVKKYEYASEHRSYILLGIHNDRVNKESEIKLTNDAYQLRINWFSFGYKLTNTSFMLFNPVAAYADQITKSNFVSHEFRGQWSYYKWSKKSYGSLFLCGGLAITYNDNLGDLSKTEITEVKNYGPNTNDRSSTKKYNAYQGQYTKDLLGVKVYADYYQFLFQNNIGAIHLFPEYIFQNKLYPVLNCGIGFMFSLKKENTASSTVNIEVFYKFQDIFNTTNSDYDFFERNLFGLNFSFPIQFK